MTFLLLYVVGVWRVTSLLLYEPGPRNVFHRIRELADANREGEVESGSMRELFTCPWCMSFWTAGALAILAFVFPRVAIFVLLILAGSAGTVAIEKKLHYGD